MHTIENYEIAILIRSERERGGGAAAARYYYSDPRVAASTREDVSAVNSSSRFERAECRKQPEVVTTYQIH